MRRVLVLRPEPGASATLRRARERGLDAFAIPLFEIEPIAWNAPDPGAFDGLLLTSANALRHGGDQLRDLRHLPAYAVGEATADEAREKGFEVVAVGDRGVDELLRSIDPGCRLLHLCGEDRREPVGSSQPITSINVYRSKLTDQPEILEASGAIALIHSPRAGSRFAELVAERGSIAIAAISRAAADSVGAGWETVELVEKPVEDALLVLAARLCNKPDL
jgi:uroporphyrinogen-III synthase